MIEADILARETFQNEARLFIFTENAGERAFASQPRGRNQSRRGQTAAVTRAPFHARLPVGGWIRRNKKQLIHRGAAQAQNVVRGRHFTMKRATAAWPAGLP